ncbi:MAG: 1-acyl-sn-glycerol-3-phosphate acyltransferase [Chthoniobacterales bacterium]|nr:1-acyl-sn-glycerol-3-phosphate acyltransferase [Chthoniobacterales bacterium]
MQEWCYRFSCSLGRVVTTPLVRLNVWHAPGAAEPSGAAIVVANHISHFDPAFLYSLIQRPVDWMTTEEFYANPLIGAWLRALNTFPVDRVRPDRRALRVGLERLAAGRLVGIFPEGGIRAGPTSILGGVAPKSGATMLARLADVPIVPCLIFGSDRLYAARSWLPGPPRVPIWMAMGATLHISAGEEEEANERLAEALRALARATIAHFDLQPDDLPTTPQRRKGREALA